MAGADPNPLVTHLAADHLSRSDLEEVLADLRDELLAAIAALAKGAKK